MTAGNNLGVRVWRMVVSPSGDDAVGGYDPSGTVLHEHIHASKNEVRPTAPLLEQGLETNKLYSFLIVGQSLLIQEQDILEITSPVTHRDYGKKYRATAVQGQIFAPNDRRNYLIVTTTRVERAHENSYQ